MNEHAYEPALHRPTLLTRHRPERTVTVRVGFDGHTVEQVGDRRARVADHFARRRRDGDEC